MSFILEDSEMAMLLLNGLPDRFDELISAVDSLGNDGQFFSFEFVAIICHQEKNFMLSETKTLM